MDGWSGTTAADCVWTTLTGPRIWNARHLAQRWRQWVLRLSIAFACVEWLMCTCQNHKHTFFSFIRALIAIRSTYSQLTSIFQNVLFWFSIVSFMSAQKTKSVRIRMEIVTENSRRMKIQKIFFLSNRVAYRRHESLSESRLLHIGIGRGGVSRSHR